MPEQQGQKPNQGTQQQEDWKKNPNQQQGGQQKTPQSDRDQFDKDQERKKQA